MPTAKAVAAKAATQAGFRVVVAVARTGSSSVAKMDNQEEDAERDSLKRGRTTDWAQRDA